MSAPVRSDVMLRARVFKVIPSHISSFCIFSIYAMQQARRCERPWHKPLFRSLENALKACVVPNFAYRFPAADRPIENACNPQLPFVVVCSMRRLLAANSAISVSGHGIRPAALRPIGPQEERHLVPKKDAIRYGTHPAIALSCALQFDLKQNG